MSIRPKISWFFKNGERIVGVKDTDTGWAVVNAKGEILLSLEGYTKENRAKIMERYNDECNK